MHRASVGRRAPANGHDRPGSHAVRHGILTKSTSPTFARSHVIFTGRSPAGRYLRLGLRN
jgi:hypothetical protein